GDGDAQETVVEIRMRERRRLRAVQRVLVEIQRKELDESEAACDDKHPAIESHSCSSTRRRQPRLTTDGVRASSGTHLRPPGPTYSDCGRMMRLARRCSCACAIHPLTRLIANVGVNSSGSNPRPCRSNAV